MILCDTDILIDFYKGDQKITQALRNIGQSNLAVSVVTKAELLYGARDKKEFDQLTRHLSQCYCLHITNDASTAFIDLMRRYALSHKPKVPDLLIAATALANGLELFTNNAKDFRFIEGIRLYQND